MHWLLEMVNVLYLFSLYNYHHYPKVPHESGMRPMDFGVKGQGHDALVTENALWCIIAFRLQLT